jgi:hypothetical protein
MNNNKKTTSITMVFNLLKKLFLSKNTLTCNKLMRIFVLKNCKSHFSKRIDTQSNCGAQLAIVTDK